MVGEVVFQFSDAMYKLPAPKGINKDTREEVLGAFYGGVEIAQLSAFIPEVETPSTPPMLNNTQGSSSTAPAKETLKKNALGTIQDIQKGKPVSKPVYIKSGQSYSDFLYSNNYPEFENQAKRLFAQLQDWSKKNLPGTSGWERLKELFFSSWAKSPDIVTTYLTLKNSLEDLLLLLHLPDAPLELKKRAMQSLLVEASNGDHPLKVCSPGVTTNVQNACGIIANSPLYAWKYNLIEQLAIEFANKYMSLKSIQRIYHTHYVNLYMVSVSEPKAHYGLNISLDAYAKSESTPSNINTFKDEIAKQFTVNNLIKSLVSNVIQEVRQVLIVSASPAVLQANPLAEVKLRNIPYAQLKDAMAVITEILKPFGEDEVFGIHELLENNEVITDEIVEENGPGDDSFGINEMFEEIDEPEPTFTCIPKSHQGLEMALYITLLRRVLANGYIEMPVQNKGLSVVENSPRKLIKFGKDFDNNMVIAPCNDQEAAQVIEEIEREAERIAQERLEAERVAREKREAEEREKAEERRKAAEERRKAAEERKILEERRIAEEQEIAARTFQENLNALSGQLSNLKTTGDYATYFLWLKENVHKFMCWGDEKSPRVAEHIRNSGNSLYSEVFSVTLSSSSLWQSSKAHVSRQQERGGNDPIFKLMKKTIYAAQKRALLEFLEQIAQQNYLVDADFWLALEAQASYTGQTDYPEKYPFLGAFDKSPRHRSQTIDGFEEAKCLWENNSFLLSLKSDKSFGDADRLGLRVNLQDREDISAKMQTQIEALNKLASTENTTSFFSFRSQALDPMKKENFEKQREIFKQLKALLFPQTQPEQVEGLTAEDWLIARHKLKQSSPATVVIKTFEEIYATWHEQAILTMQKKMKLGPIVTQAAVNGF